MREGHSQGFDGRLGSLLAVLSGGLLVASFPGSRVSYVAWLALVPLLLVLRRSTPRQAFLFSLTAGTVFQGLLHWWLVPAGLTPPAFCLATLGCAVYVGVFGLLAREVERARPRWTPLTVPAAWVTLEFVRSNLGWLAVPSGVLGYSQYKLLPVAQLASVTGVYGVSFAIVSANVVLADLAERALSGARSPRRPGWPAVAVLGGLLVLWGVALHDGMRDPGEERHLRVGLVQAGVYASRDGDPRRRLAVFERYRQLSHAAATFGPDLIVWPESAVPAPIPGARDAVALLERLSGETNAHLLVATTGQDKTSRGLSERPRANSAFLFSPERSIVARYDKIRLVPFNEYVPLRGYVRWPPWIAAEMTDAVSGERRTLFTVDGARFAVLICWENLFGREFRRSVTRGVEFMVSMTNEAFTQVPFGHYQMLGMNVFRAIENRVAIIRTATTGVSAIITPTGEILARVQDDHAEDLEVEGYLVGEIPLSSTRSFYSRFGDVFVYLMALLLLGVLVASLGSPLPRGGEPKT